MRRILTSLGIVAVLASAVLAQPSPVRNPSARACEDVSVVARKAPGTRVRRTSGSVSHELLRDSISGCRVHITGSFKSLGSATAVPERLREWFESNGWKELPEFSADGHDGTSFAYASERVGCLTRGAWDGGSDDQPDAPRADPYAVAVLCGPVSAFVRR